jgi:hypothetical protein
MEIGANENMNWVMRQLYQKKNHPLKTYNNLSYRKLKKL